MDIKLYREIIKYLNYQKQVIESFESERDYLIHDDIRIFIKSLKENLCLLEENTEKIIDGSD